MLHYVGLYRVQQLPQLGKHCKTCLGNIRVIVSRSVYRHLTSMEVVFRSLLAPVFFSNHNIGRPLTDRLSDHGMLWLLARKLFWCICKAFGRMHFGSAWPQRWNTDWILFSHPPESPFEMLKLRDSVPIQPWFSELEPTGWLKSRILLDKPSSGYSSVSSWPTKVQGKAFYLPGFTFSLSPNPALRGSGTSHSHL